MRRGLPLTVGAVVIGVMAAGLVALRAQAGPGGCRSGDPMTNVRDPGRLEVRSRSEDADRDADTDAAPAAGAAPSPVQYIGLEFPPVAVPQEFPAGVEHLDQILLVDADRDPRTPATDMVERVRKDGWDMIWLERSD